MALNAEYYVSPSGNDRNAGTSDSPFRTLAKARDTIRAGAASMKQDVTVYLRGGVHRLGQTLVLDARDSGCNGHKVIYAAAQGDKPVISGGRAISGWQPAGNGVWKAKSPVKRFRQLYVNGTRRTRARYPNYDDHFFLKRWDEQTREIIINAADAIDLKGRKDVEIVVQMVWAEAYMRLESIRVEGDEARVVVAEHERGIVFPRPFPMKWENQPFYYENAQEFIDTAGEWYVNNASGEVFYKPMPGEDMAKAVVVAPELETLVRIEGTLNEPVHDIEFRGISFEHATWLRPCDYGYLAHQAGMFNTRSDTENNQYIGRPAAAVYVAAAHDIRFERNTFRNVGSSGLDLAWGACNNAVVGNVFTDIAGSGVVLAQFAAEDYEIHQPFRPGDEREVCRGNLIANNYITKVGQDYFGCVGVGVGFAAGTRIEHNEITRTPYTGISVGWGWTSLESCLRDNIIRRNDVHHVMQVTTDGAAVYTLSRQPGTTIEENYIHDFQKAKLAKWLPVVIYLDEGSGAMTVRNNKVVNVETKDDLVHENRKIRTKEVIDWIPNKIENNGPGVNDSVVRNAGIEPAYRDIIPA